MQNVEEPKDIKSTNNINSNNNKPKKEDDLLILSNNLNTLINNNKFLKDQKETSDFLDRAPPRDEATDTFDLIPESTFDFESLKKNYLNNLISWSFLKKLSDMNQWPLGCLGNIVENSFKYEVQAKNIHVDVRAYYKQVYKGVERNYPEVITESFLKRKYAKSDGTPLSQVSNFADKILVLSVKDDGKGIPASEFNKALYSFSLNESKEYNFYKYGISLKTSAIRIANSFFIISKTESEVNIGLMAKSLQNKLDTDFVFTPIVNYTYNEMNLSYIAKSNLSAQSLNFIISEVKFLFFDQDEVFNYITKMKTGTHIFLYDLKQNSANKDDVNELKNYELLFDFNNNDIYYNFFDIQIGERNFIDCSFRTYVKFLFIDFTQDCSFYLFGKKINLSNPLKNIFEILNKQQKHNLNNDASGINSNKINKNNSNNKFSNNEVAMLKHNLKYEGKEGIIKGFLVDNEIYKGVLFNEALFNKIKEENESLIFNGRNAAKLNCENEEEIYFYDENDFGIVFNGVLLYSNNRLISRCKQYKFGEIKYFVKKFDNFHKKKKQKKMKHLFPITGFFEMPFATYQTLYNKTVRKNNF